jgi:uridine kinase
MFIIGITGGTGSGKTTLAKKLRNYIGRDKCIIISQDNYYKDRSSLDAKLRRSINYDHPSAFDNRLLYQHLTNLRAGKFINMPTYDFSTHTRMKNFIRVQPTDITILEGLTIFMNSKILKEIDLKIYIEVPDDIRLIRRIRRDMKERNRSIASILNQYLSYVKPMHSLYVDSQKKFADIILDGNEINSSTIKAILKKLKYKS